MTEHELIAKYSVWGEHPQHSSGDWRFEVANGDTRLGYWAWVEARIELDGN